MKNFSIVIISLLLAGSCFAQTKAPQQRVSLFFEKVFIHTDRQIYTAGDDLWFKAYVVNAQDNRPLNASKVMYVDLIDPNAKVILQEKINIDTVGGQGDFHLTDDLKEGVYRLRAYTNWMRNFGTNFVFEKELQIISKSPSQKRPTPVRQPSISVYPEGGSLVEGVSSRVAVKADTDVPQGKASLGSVLSTSGDTVAKFAIDTLGMGSFTLLPLPGQKYRAVLNSGQTMTPLPDPLKQGLTLKIVKKDAQIYAVISCSEVALSTYASQTLNLKARAYGKLLFQQDLQLKSGRVAVLLPSTGLPNGIICITLYDSAQRPNCERLLFNEDLKHPVVTLKTNQPHYGARSRLTADIELKDEKGQALSGNFSLSAVDASLIPEEKTNILSYLLLESELKGDIKNPAIYFDTKNDQRFKQLDLLLMTQGWRDFLWKRLADSTLRISYLPEQGISLAGTVMDKKKSPLSHANISLITAGANNGRLFAAQTDNNGRYYFDDLQVFGTQSIRLTSKDSKGSPVGNLAIDSTSGGLPVLAQNGKKVSAILANAIANNKKAEFLKSIDQAQQRSLSDTLIRLKEVTVTDKNRMILRDQTVTDFGYKDEVLTVTAEDKRYNTLRDYVQFASKQAHVDAETNRLFFMADGKKVSPRIILNNRDALFTDTDPADVRDMISSSYFDLPVTSVEKVVIKKVIGGPSLMVNNPDSTQTDPSSTPQAAASNRGGGSLNPVFLIYLTLKPDALKKPETGALQAQLKGFYEKRIFYSPIYSSNKTDNRVDGRVTIHWEPNLKTDVNGHASISFFNNDKISVKRLTIQGITKTGQPFFVSTVSGDK